MKPLKPLFLLFYSLLGGTSWAFCLVIITAPDISRYESALSCVLGLVAMAFVSRLVCDWAMRFSKAEPEEK